MNARKLILTATLATLFALPATASAETFCVHSPANCVGTSKSTLQGALDAANVNGVNTKDTIRVGVGLFNEGPVVDVAGNKVDIIGKALNQTAFTTSSTTGGLTILDIQEPASTISDLRVHHTTAAPTATGIKLKGEAENVMVSSGPSTGQFDGIRLEPGAELDEVSVTLVYPPTVQNRAVYVPAGGGADIQDSSLDATVGVSATGDVEVVRTRIKAQQGVVAGGGSTVKVRDTEIKIPGTFDSNFQAAALAAAGNGPTSLEADRVTAIGDGPGTYGLWVVPNGGAGNDATIDLQGSVLHGFGTAIAATQNGGSTAKAYTNRSAYSLASTSLSGGATVMPTNNLNLTGVDPRFIDTQDSQVDLRLRHDSPLIDAGDPGYQPFLGGLDVFERTRVRNGNAPGSPVVDMGAHEYQRLAPDAVAKATPGSVQTDQTVSFSGQQSSDPDNDPITYAWSFDDGATATGATAQHAFATAGTHSATLTVTDVTGLAKTATVQVEVVGPATQPPTGQPPVNNPPSAALRLGALRLSPATFRARKTRGEAKASAKKRRRAPVGTSIGFTLTNASRVTFAIDRAVSGRKVGKACRKPTRANRKRKACVRWVKVGGFARTGNAGANTIRFDGRLAGKPMAAGRYRLRARAKDDQGRTSAPAAPKRFAIATS